MVAEHDRIGTPFREAPGSVLIKKRGGRETVPAEVDHAESVGLYRVKREGSRLAIVVVWAAGEYEY